jgi:hypothetical protein
LISDDKRGDLVARDSHSIETAKNSGIPYFTSFELNQSFKNFKNRYFSPLSEGITNILPQKTS